MELSQLPKLPIHFANSSLGLDKILIVDFAKRLSIWGVNPLFLLILIHRIY